MVETSVRFFLDIGDATAEVSIPLFLTHQVHSTGTGSVRSRDAFAAEGVMVVVDRIDRDSTYESGPNAVVGHTVNRLRIEHGCQPIVTPVIVPGAADSMFLRAEFEDPTSGTVQFRQVVAARGQDLVSIQAVVRKDITGTVGEALNAALLSIELREVEK